MSDQTGVVAVLAAEIEAAHAWRVHAKEQSITKMLDANDALKAVAELIAAVEEYYAAEAGLGIHANGPMTRRLQRYYNAEKRLAAALQACKGGA